MTKRFLFLQLLFLGFTALAAQLSLAPGRTAKISGFTSSGVISSFHCEADISRDSKNLYVAISCDLAPGETLRSPGRNIRKPEMIFAGETMEVILAPRPQSGIYYHIAISPDGVLYTARKRDTSWQNSVSASTSVSNGKWQSRFVIPFADLGEKTPADKSIWKANFAVSRESSGIPSACWSNAVNYHSIEQLGELRFDGENIPFFSRLYVKDNNTLVIKANFEQADYVRYSVEVNGKTSSYLTDKAMEIKLDGNEIGHKRFFHQIKINAIPWICQTLFTGVNCELNFDGFAVVYPAAHFDIDRFYYRRGESLSFAHSCPPGAVITLADENNQTLLTIPSASQGKVKLDLPPGKYYFKLASGKHHASRIFHIVSADDKLIKRQKSPDFQTDGKFFSLDGKKEFLLGTSSSTSKVPVSGEFFNFRTGNFGHHPFGTILTGLPGKKMTYRPEAGFKIDPGFKSIIAEKMRNISPENRIFRLSYECHMPLYLENQQIPLLQYYSATAQTLREVHPQAIVSTHSHSIPVLQELAHLCDALEIAAWESGYSKDMLLHLDRDLKNIRRELPDKPLIIWLGASVPSPRDRTAEELYAGAYLALLNDFAGTIFHMGHGGIPADNTRIWSLYRGIGIELQKFSRDFLTKKPARDFLREIPVRFAAAAREDDKEIILLIINLDGFSKTVSLDTAAGKKEIFFAPLEPKIIKFPK